MNLEEELARLSVEVQRYKSAHEESERNAIEWGRRAAEAERKLSQMKGSLRELLLEYRDELGI